MIYTSRGRKTRRICPWCKTSFLEGRRDQRFCTTKCRQASWRFGVKPSRVDPKILERRFAYADPPYPGKSGYYPEGEEIDLPSLITKLQEFDGWALSTSAEALPKIVPSLEYSERIAIWIRRVIPAKSARPLNAWEPLIYKPIRPLCSEDVQTVVDVLDYRGRYTAFPGAMVGMKPPQFSVWMFGLVAAVPGDAFYDLYPGSGAVSLAWNRFACTNDD